LLTKGDEEPGGEDRASPGEHLEERAVGMALGVLHDSSVAACHRLQGGAEVGDESLDQERIGSHDTVVGGEREGRCDGLDTVRHDLRRAHVMIPERRFPGSNGGQAARL
jgi:hypothetical protein